MARTSSAAAFSTASRRPSTSALFSALRRSVRCISRVITWPSRVTPIMGPTLLASWGVSRIGALELLDSVLDEGSFRSWDAPPLEVEASEAYQGELAAAKTATGLDESVVTGEGTVFGRRVALVVCEFDFLAASIGVSAAERIPGPAHPATVHRRPL